MFGNGKNKSTSTISNGFNNAVNTFNTGVEALGNNANTFGNNLYNTANTAINNAANAMTGVPNATSTINSYFNSFNKGNTNKGNTNKGNTNNNNSLFSNNSIIESTSTLFSSKETPSWAYPLLVFIIFASIFTGIFYVYNNELGAAFSNIIDKIKVGLGYDAPASPQTNLDTNEHSGIIEKILPVSRKEVFNVSSNDYTYYDAEPLCRALGAELATYDQVKTAWENGADWCNYGWVKGQVAVYPTQRESWEKLQGGPDEEKEACGIPGINGGFFDNPEMKFGVTCYGDKPAQSANDQRILMEKGAIPRTTEMLKVDERVQDFKNQLGTIGLLPFNHSSWEET